MDHIVSSIRQLLPKSIGVDNISMTLTLLLALALGVMIGYERTYNGRAAGMRTYGLVAMASSALILILGHPEQWFNGHAIHVPDSDPTRVIQGIVTGIGFLCGGVIIKDAFSITGLTTAASIWSCAVIGIVVGLGFYTEAIIYSLLQFCLMFILFRLELILPSKHSLVIHLTFEQKGNINLDNIHHLLEHAQYHLIPGSISLQYHCEKSEISLQAISQQEKKSHTLIAIANALEKLNGIINVNLSYSSNLNTNAVTKGFINSLD